ncbi:CAP domain-containing protein [Streptomyces sp. NPDC058157]|uniref:CAP domain-containing protein n=1 Tax=Streptomyces sp. NPDC058157 TaxID=3346360 RepID=UPI0036EE2DEC
MRKHRKKTHYRKIAVAVGALAMVGVPTAAMACLGPQGTGPAHTAAAARQDQDQDQDRDPAPGRPQAQPRAQIPVAIPDSVPPAPAEPVAEPPAEQAVDTPPPAAPRPAAPPAEPAAAPSAPQASGAQASGAPADVQAAVVALVNQERAAAGCPALTVNPMLTQAAQDHSADMAAHATMSHTGSDGSDPGARITRAGYPWQAYGENVAYGYGTPEQVMEGWMNSPGHRRNILDCSYREIGIGLAQPGQYWTQDFGATR